jgi:hypothetical protein
MARIKYQEAAGLEVKQGRPPVCRVLHGAARSARGALKSVSHKSSSVN